MYSKDGNYYNGNVEEPVIDKNRLDFDRYECTSPDPKRRQKNFD